MTAPLSASRVAVASIVFLCAPLLWAQPPAAPKGMVTVAGGTFTMGGDGGLADEAPAHRVTLSPFFIDRNEVTIKSFADFVRLTKSTARIEGAWYRYSARACLDIAAFYESRHRGPLGKFRAGHDKDLIADRLRWRAAYFALVKMSKQKIDVNTPSARWAKLKGVATLLRAQRDLPARGVSWRDANAFCTYKKLRLPTEAEWEFAARPKAGSTYPWGDTWDGARLCAALSADAGPKAVGSFPRGASAAGALDMAGNVWEWVADWYGEDYYARSKGSVDPQGPQGLKNGELPRGKKAAPLRSTAQGRENDTRKVIRGGGFAGTSLQARFNARVRRRLFSNPSYGHPDVGFRCAKSAGKEAR